VQNIAEKFNPLGSTLPKGLNFSAILVGATSQTDDKRICDDIRRIKFVSKLTNLTKNFIQYSGQNLW